MMYIHDPVALATATGPRARCSSTTYPTGAIESLEPSLGFAALRAAFGPIAAAHLADPGIDPLDRYIGGLIQCDAAKVDTCKTHQRIFSTQLNARLSEILAPRTSSRGSL